MFSRIKRSPRKYAIYAVVAIIIVAVYMLQARTTVEYGEYMHNHLCSHAHLGGHERDHGPPYDLEGKKISAYTVTSVGFEFTFFNHYHRLNSQLVSCDDGPRQVWGTSKRRISFDMRENEPSDNWPEWSGVYVFVKHTDEQRYPIYVGRTDNLKETLRNPSDHEEWSCLSEKGQATHIHARLSYKEGKTDEDESDVALLIDTFSPPCNEN